MMIHSILLFFLWLIGFPLGFLIFNLNTVDGYLFISDQAKPKLPMKSNLTGIQACRKIRTTKVFIHSVLKVDFLGYVNNGVVCHREYGQFTDNL